MCSDALVTIRCRFLKICFVCVKQSAQGELLWPAIVRRRPPFVVRQLLYLNIFSSETPHWILIKLHMNGPWVVPYQSCSNGSDWLDK